MNSILEIEAALRRLPRQDTWEIARWLLEYLAENAEGKSRGETPDNGSSMTPAQATAPVKLPDYAARRRRIFGDKVLPNMVLMAREQERW
ncbi:MAG: hypothetical protein AAB676_07900 [Verrucomicrobiota bacterium]